MRSKRLGALGVLMALGALVLPVQNAAANHAATLEIQVGHYIDTGRNGLQAEIMRFFPEDITVHKGDTLTFLGGFHVPLMIPTSATDATTWIAENAADPSDPYFYVQPNPDYEGFGLKLLGNDGFTPRTDCGSPETPCSYTGADVVDARPPLFAYGSYDPATDTETLTGFNVTVDVEPGESFWVIDKMFPDNRLRVAVVNPNEDTTTQEAIDAARETTIREDTVEARRIHDSLLDARRVSKIGGRRVFDVFAGYDTETISFYEFYPQRLSIRRRERVAWNFGTLKFEVHSASGPTKKALRIHNQGQPLVCDPNGDETSGGETQVTSFPPTCDPGFSEQLLGDRFMGMAGDRVVTSPTDLAHSGVRGPGLGDEPYIVQFKNKSGTRWNYICVVHPDMKGSVSVK